MNDKLIPGKLYSLKTNPIYKTDPIWKPIINYQWKFSQTTDSFTLCFEHRRDVTYTNVFLVNEQMLYIKKEESYNLCHLFLYKTKILRLMREEIITFRNAETIFLRDWELM